MTSGHEIINWEEDDAKSGLIHVPSVRCNAENAHAFEEELLTHVPDPVVLSEEEEAFVKGFWRQRAQELCDENTVCLHAIRGSAENDKKPIDNSTVTMMDTWVCQKTMSSGAIIKAQ